MCFGIIVEIHSTKHGEIMRLILILTLVSISFSQKWNFGSMRAGLNTGTNIFSVGYGGQFEFGIGKRWAVQAFFREGSFDEQYPNSTHTWTATPIDLWVMNYMFKNASKGGFYWGGGPSITKFSVNVVNHGNDLGGESATKIFYGAGVGYIAKLSKKVHLLTDMRFRLTPFETDNFEFSTVWFGMNAGLSYVF